MTKLHFRPYNPNQTLLFPGRIDEDIAADDPVRVVSSLVDSLDLSSIKTLYKEYDRSPYHPQMMLKVIFYAYMNNVYSCRKIESKANKYTFVWRKHVEKNRVKLLDKRILLSDKTFGLP